MESGKIEQAIARLRASRLNYEEMERAHGKARGLQWALEDADYPALKAVADYEPEQPIEDAWYDLCTVILGDKNPSLHQVHELQGWLLGDDEDDAPSPAWVEGFVAGAKEVWAEIGDKL
jgi:hypothetical protein